MWKHPPNSRVWKGRENPGGFKGKRGNGETFVLQCIYILCIYLELFFEHFNKTIRDKWEISEISYPRIPMTTSDLQKDEMGITWIVWVGWLQVYSDSGLWIAMTFGAKRLRSIIASTFFLPGRWICLEDISKKQLVRKLRFLGRMLGEFSIKKRREVWRSSPLLDTFPPFEHIPGIHLRKG